MLSCREQLINSTECCLPIRRMSEGLFFIIGTGLICVISKGEGILGRERRWWGKRRRSSLNKFTYNANRERKCV